MMGYLDEMKALGVCPDAVRCGMFRHVVSAGRPEFRCELVWDGWGDPGKTVRGVVVLSEEDLHVAAQGGERSLRVMIVGKLFDVIESMKRTAAENFGVPRRT